MPFFIFKTVVKILPALFIVLPYLPFSIFFRCSLFSARSTMTSVNFSICILYLHVYFHLMQISHHLFAPFVYPGHRRKNLKFPLLIFSPFFRRSCNQEQRCLCFSLSLGKTKAAVWRTQQSHIRFWPRKTKAFRANNEFLFGDVLFVDVRVDWEGREGTL